MDKTEVLNDMKKHLEEIIPALTTDQLNALVHYIKKEINFRAYKVMGNG